MNPQLKPCPHCNGPLKISHYSEDGASVTEITCESEKCMPDQWRAKRIDSHYEGETSWMYNREGCNKRYENFLNKWKAPTQEWTA